MNGHDNSMTKSPPKNTTLVNKKARSNVSGRNPPRDLLQEKRNALHKGAWAMDESMICEHFGQAAYESRWFLEGLICLAKAQPSFSAAWQLLKKTYKSKHAGETLPAGGPGHWAWSRQDITHANEMITSQITAPKTLPNAVSRRQNQNIIHGGSENGPTSKSGNPSDASTALSPSEYSPYSSSDGTVAPEPRDLLPATSIASTPKRGSLRAEVRQSSLGNLHPQALTSTVSNIQDKVRQEVASHLVAMLIFNIKKDIKSGSFSVPAGKSAGSIGLELGLIVEYAIYSQYWGSEAEHRAQYEAEFEMLLERLSSNSQLRRQVLTKDISPEQLCALSDEDIARAFPVKSNIQQHADGTQVGDRFNPSSPINQESERNSIKVQGKKRSHAKDLSKTHQEEKTSVEGAAGGHQTISDAVTPRDKKRDRSEEVFDVQEQGDGQELANKIKEDCERIQGLNEITKEYVQPDPEDVAVTYLDTCLVLPSDAPLGWPHLIDLSSLFKNDTTGLHVADMIVTVLYNHSPDTLARFMDMSHGFTFHVKELPTSDNQDLLIVRTATTVTCGFVTEDRRWIVKHRYGLRATPMAKWTPLWLEEFTGEDLEERLVVDDVVTVMVAGEALAYGMLEAKVWVPAEGARIHIRNSAAWRS